MKDEASLRVSTIYDLDRSLLRVGLLFYGSHMKKNGYKGKDETSEAKK